MHPQRVESLSHAQRERLAYVEFRLYFMGEIGRPDLAGRFGVAPAGATRDLRTGNSTARTQVRPQNRSTKCTPAHSRQSDFPRIYAAVTTTIRKGEPQAQPRPGGGTATVVRFTT